MNGYNEANLKEKRTRSVVRKKGMLKKMCRKKISKEEKRE